MAKVAAISQNFFVLTKRAGRNRHIFNQKAVERLGDKGLLLSLSIAFFIVLAATLFLSLVYRGMAVVDKDLLPNNNRAIYMMEKG